jgi:hypothetical protein
LRLGRRDEAAALLAELVRDYPKDEGGVFSSVQALLAASTGNKTKSEGEIRNAIEKGKGFGHFHHTAYNVACAYSLMKKTEAAFKWLQAAADDGFPCYPIFESDPYLDHLRHDPCFIALMTKLKKSNGNTTARCCDLSASTCSGSVSFGDTLEVTGRFHVSARSTWPYHGLSGN